jgi:hypothetical protein
MIPLKFEDVTERGGIPAEPTEMPMPDDDERCHLVNTDGLLAEMRAKGIKPSRACLQLNELFKGSSCGAGSH